MMDNLNNKKTSRELFKNTGIIAIGQISTKMMNFFLLPVYTAFLTTEEYGLIDLLSTYSSLISVIVGLQLSQAIFRFLVTSRDSQEETSVICSTVIAASSVAIMVYSLAFLLISPWISLNGKWFLLLHVIATVYLQTLTGIVRGVGNNRDYAIANFLSAIVTLLINITVIAVLHLGAGAMLAAYIIGPFVGGTYLVIKVRLWEIISWKNVLPQKLKKILSFALPLIPNELSWSVIHVSDRVVVSAVLSIAANGLIAVASKFSAIYTTAFYIFNTSWTEQVVLHYKDKGGPQYICKMFDQMVSFFGSIAIGIIACMPFVFPLLINEQYGAAYGLVPFYMMAVFFNVIIGLISAIYLVENETKLVAISTMAAALVNLVTDILLIHWVGMYAAPLSSICGYATISIWRLIDVNKRHCAIGMPIKKVVILFFMLVMSMVGFYSTTLVVQIICVVVIAGAALYLNLNFFRELLHLK